MSCLLFGDCLWRRFSMQSGQLRAVAAVLATAMGKDVAASAQGDLLYAFSAAAAWAAAWAGMPDQPAGLQPAVATITT